jgi:hypothetical protein
VFKQAGTTIAALYQSPFASGTISQSITWSITKTLTGNVSVATGATLTIATGVTVNLNGYNIVDSIGGTITRQSGVTINGLKATLYDNSNATKGFFGNSIQSAITAAPSMNSLADYVEIEPGNYDENISASNKYALQITGRNPNATTINGYCSFYDCDFLICYDFKARGVYLNGCVYAHVVRIKIGLP